MSEISHESTFRTVFALGLLCPFRKQNKPTGHCCPQAPCFHVDLCSNEKAGNQESQPAKHANPAKEKGTIHYALMGNASNRLVYACVAVRSFAEYVACLLVTLVTKADKKARAFANHSPRLLR